MTQELSKEINKTIADIQDTQKMCSLLMQAPHYKKIGLEGVYAIVEKARSIGVNPIDALNGGMYYVHGKVELSATMMNQLIRGAGHHISKDKRSSSTECILHGKRADNGDVWSESFSIEDAKLAGIYKNQWLRYPKDMLFARALSRLARQLFPDVIKGCYVEGEIQVLSSVDVSKSMEEEKLQITDCISNEEYEELDKWLSDNQALRANISKFLERSFGSSDLSKMPKNLYDAALKRAKDQYVEREQILGEKLQALGE